MNAEKPKVVNLTRREKNFFDAGKAQGCVEALKMVKVHITKVKGALESQVQPIGFVTACVGFLKTLKTKKADVSWVLILDQISGQFDESIKVNGIEGNKKLIAALEETNAPQKKKRKRKKNKNK